MKISNLYTIYSMLSEEEYEALETYAGAYGRRWKSHLAKNWSLAPEVLRPLQTKPWFTLADFRFKTDKDHGFVIHSDSIYSNIERAESDRGQSFEACKRELLESLRSLRDEYARAVQRIAELTEDDIT